MDRRIISDKTHRAVEEFTRLLLKSQSKQEIVKVILFGSVARGEAREDSDIDLLIIPERIDFRFVFLQFNGNRP